MQVSSDLRPVIRAATDALRVISKKFIETSGKTAAVTNTPLPNNVIFPNGTVEGKLPQSLTLMTISIKGTPIYSVSTYGNIIVKPNNQNLSYSVELTIMQPGYSYATTSVRFENSVSPRIFDVTGQEVKFQGN